MRVDIRDARPFGRFTDGAEGLRARCGLGHAGEPRGPSRRVRRRLDAEIILPPTELLGGYPSAVLKPIDTLTRIASADKSTHYRDLVTVDLNVMRVRGTETSFRDDA